MDVTSISVARANQIANNSIVSGEINESRQLILENGAGATFIAGSVDPLPWEDFVPYPAAAPGYGVTYARLAIIGGLCQIQVHYTNFQAVVFNPGFEAPVPPAAHYFLPGAAPGYIGRMFPGTCHWAGGPSANDVGVLTTQTYDLGIGRGDRLYILGAQRSGAAVDTFSAPVQQLFFETTYEIAPAIT